MFCLCAFKHADADVPHLSWTCSLQSTCRRRPSDRGSRARLPEELRRGAHLCFTPSCLLARCLCAGDHGRSGPVGDASVGRRAVLRPTDRWDPPPKKSDTHTPAWTTLSTLTGDCLVTSFACLGSGTAGTCLDPASVGFLLQLWVDGGVEME